MVDLWFWLDDSADDSVGSKPRSEMGSAAIHTALKSGADLIFVYVSSEGK